MKSSEIKRQFKQLPNYQPVSQLFDANHLDLFIKKHEYMKQAGTPLGVSVKRSDFMTQSMDKLTIAKEYAQEQQLRASQIRPSSTFLLQSRDGSFTSIQMMPKTLFNSKTDQNRTITSTDFKTKDYDHNKNYDQVVQREKQLRSTLNFKDYYGSEPTLANPDTRKLENIQRKQEIIDFAQVKEEKRLFKQRDRLMASAWRNGVTGVKVLPNEDPQFSLRSSLRKSCKLNTSDVTVFQT